MPSSAPACHEVHRPRASLHQLDRAAAAIRAARAPLIVSGGGVHYSMAEGELAGFAARHRIPVVETVAGKSSLVAEHPSYVGPIGVTGSDPVNGVAADADCVIAIGTRLQDFTTGSWTVFANPAMTLVSLNSARADAHKHRSLAVVGDARESLADLAARLEGWRAPPEWQDRARRAAAEHRDVVAAATAAAPSGAATYSQVIGAVHRAARDDDYVLTAAGGLPGELNVNWLSKAVATVDIEYGFSCMGYEISGGWGAAMARRSGEVFVLVGDGSYLMLNSDLYSSVLTGHRMIVVVCDNGGYAVIDRLQVAQGGRSFNNLLSGLPGHRPPSRRLRRPCRGHGLRRRQRREHRRAGGGAGARSPGFPDLGDLHPHRSARLDPGGSLLGGRGT